ncbi:hypothetical protein JCM10207_000879 [Rhodosporidiobolus poonsookiae]
MPPTAAAASSRSDQPSVLPRDARLIALLLAAAGAEDCEEGVVRMLVEFAHRYTTDILTDALMYADHARAGSSSTAPVVPSLDDLRLAVQARTEGAQVPKEFLLHLSTTVNSIPLPPLPEVYGIRLPPPAQRLTAPNFSLVPRSSPLPGSSVVEGLPELALDPSLGMDLSGGAGGGEGLFGDDDDEDAEGDEDDEDDEEMEDVTAGIPGLGGAMSGEFGGGAGGTKRKAPGESDEEYD